MKGMIINIRREPYRLENMSGIPILYIIAAREMGCRMCL